MLYGRNPYYIFSDGDRLYLDGVYVDESVINAFLYKILLTNRRDELLRRLKEGKETWLHKTKYNGDILEEISQDDSEIIYEKKWMDECEDEILKNLMK